MVKLLNYYPKGMLLLVAVLLVGCQEKGVLYQNQLSQEDEATIAEYLLNGAGTDLYYQGSVAERMLILESKSIDSLNGDVYRELGVPYLKRGFAAEAFHYYSLASELKPEPWLGYKAYGWLYFYRDYEQALQAIEAYDALTPDFVDYPQATSVDYMRGLCYIHLEDYQKAIFFLQKHFAKEMQDVGPEYVDIMSFLALAMAHFKAKDLSKAADIIAQGLQYNPNSADLWYYNALVKYQSGQLTEAAEALQKAEDWLSQGNSNKRPYVEEFFAIYQEDIERLRQEL